MLCPHPSLTNQVQAKYSMLWYNRLPWKVFQIHWFQSWFQKGETNIQDFLWLILVEHEPNQWKIKGTRMNPCPWFFSGQAFRIIWLLMDKRNRFLAIFIIHVWKQGAGWNKRNRTLSGIMLWRGPFGNWNAHHKERWPSRSAPKYFGTTACS